MAAVTRLGLWGHNTRRGGDFSGREPAPSTVANIAVVAASDAVLTLAEVSAGLVTTLLIEDAVVTLLAVSNERSGQ